MGLTPIGGLVLLDELAQAMNAPTELTISSGAVTVTQLVHTVDTESDASSDDLDTLTFSGSSGIVYIAAANAARTVVVKHGTGNILLGGAADISLDDGNKALCLVYDGTNWHDTAVGITDHGALGGLSDDDHTIYSLADGTRAFTGEVAGITPTADASLATKGYVDGVAEGLRGKGLVDAVADSDVASLSGTTTIDSESLTAGEVVLLTAQSTATENGPWVIAAGSWTRPDNFAAGSEASMAYWYCDKGATYADTRWWCTTDTGSDVVDTDTLTISQFSGATEITAGDGLTKTGNTLAVDSDVERTTNKDSANGYVGLDANSRAAASALTITSYLVSQHGEFSLASGQSATDVTGDTGDDASYDRTSYIGAIVLIGAERGTTRAETGMLVISSPTGSSPTISPYLDSNTSPGLTWSVTVSTDTVKLQLATDSVDGNATDVRYSLFLIPVPPA